MPARTLCRNAKERDGAGVQPAAAAGRRARRHFANARVSRDRSPAPVGVMATER